MGNRHCRTEQCRLLTEPLTLPAGTRICFRADTVVVLPEEPVKEEPVKEEPVEEEPVKEDPCGETPSGCTAAIDWMLQDNRWKGSQYAGAGFPDPPSRKHIQQYLHDCEERKCQKPACVAWKPNCSPAGCPSVVRPSGDAGKQYDANRLHVLTWNVEGYCSSRTTPPYKGIQAELARRYFDILALQETGEQKSDMCHILRNTHYLQYYDPFDSQTRGIAIAWNAYRFEQVRVGKTKIVDDDAACPGCRGPRSVVYALLREKTGREVFICNYHGCIGCPNPRAIATTLVEVMRTNGGCEAGVIPLFLCDCQGSFAVYRAEFEAALKVCWQGDVQRKEATPGPNPCGAIDFVYYPPQKLLAENVTSFGGTCGCSGADCDPCGAKDSDHRAVLVTFRVVT